MYLIIYFSLKYYRSACYPYDDPDVVEIKKRVAEAELREIRKYNFVVDQLECSLPKNNKNLHTVSLAVERYVRVVAFFNSIFFLN